MSNDDEFERILRLAWERVRQRWPNVNLDYQDFVRFVLQRLSAEGRNKPSASQLEPLFLVDLYIALACQQRRPNANQVLEEEYLSKLPGLLGYLKLSSMDLDEVCQTVRIHLLLGSAQAGPRIGEYMGRGPLLNWMKVIAVRMALRQQGVAPGSSEESLPGVIGKLAAPEADPELDLIRHHFRAEFQQAVRQALASLPRQQRYLLRLHFIDQLSTTELGRLFGKNQSTISRWLKSAREAVYDKTKHFLKERLGLNSQEFASLLSDVRSQLDVYISQFLGESSASSSRDTELDRLLQRAWDRAVLHWPQFRVDYESYAEFVFHLRWDGAEAVGRMDPLVLQDLYLVFACLRGVKGAAEALVEEYLSKLPGLLGDLELSPTQLDEVCRTVHDYVLSGTDETGPRLNEYLGRVSLLNWMMVIAVRLALRRDETRE